MVDNSTVGQKIYTGVDSNVLLGEDGVNGAQNTQGTQGAQGADGVKPKQVDKEALDHVNKNAGANKTDEGPTDARGAPRLPLPSQTFSVADMTDLLRSIQTKNTEQQLKTSQEGVESAKLKAAKNTESQLEKIKEWVDASKKAESKGFWGKLFGWIGKVVAFLAAAVLTAAAAVATVATAGAAAPLLAVAAIGLVAASMSLASAISQECGGPEISFGSLIKETVGRFLTDVCGVDPKLADNICKVLGGVMAVAAPILLAVEPGLIGDMAKGIALMAGADEATAGYIGMAFGIAAAVTVGIAMAVASGGTSLVGSATNVAMQATLQTLKTFNTIVNATNLVVSGSTQIAQGGLTIAKGQSEKEAQGALADQEALKALMIKLQAQMEEGREEMKKIIQQIEESGQIVTQMLAGAADSSAQIALNMGGRTTA